MSNRYIPNIHINDKVTIIVKTVFLALSQTERQQETLSEIRIILKCQDLVRHYPSKLPSEPVPLPPLPPGVVGVVVVEPLPSVLVVYVLVKHLIDIGEVVGSLQFLCLLVEGCAFLAVLGVGVVGVEPCGGGRLLGGKLLALCLLLLGGGVRVGIGELGEEGGDDAHRELEHGFDGFFVGVLGQYQTLKISILCMEKQGKVDWLKWKNTSHPTSLSQKPPQLSWS